MTAQKSKLGSSAVPPLPRTPLAPPHPRFLPHVSSFIFQGDLSLLALTGLLPVEAQEVPFDLLSLCHRVLTHKITRLKRGGEGSRDRKLMSNYISYLKGPVTPGLWVPRWGRFHPE